MMEGLPKIGQLSPIRVSLSGIDDKAAESAEQDQTARMCRLILLYTLRKIYQFRERKDSSQCTSVVQSNSMKQVHFIVMAVERQTDPLFLAKFFRYTVCFAMVL